MDGIYDPTADQSAVQRSLAQVAALRKQSMNLPQGQMVSGHYVKPALTQQLLPVLSGALADFKESKADKKQADIQRMSQAALQAWMEARPQAGTVYGAGDEGPTMEQYTPTEADTTNWAASGMMNPATRGLAGEVLKDTIVNAPIRAEKAEAKLEQTRMLNDRFTQDREARAELQRERLQQQWNANAARLASSALDRETRVELQRQNNEIRQQIAGAQIESRERLAGSANEARVAAAQIKGTQAGKPLSESARKNLVEATGEVQRIAGFKETFKDEYAGAKAQFDVTTGGSFLRNDPQAQATKEWWRDFYANENVDRHKLFGSALTAQEKGEWKKTTVNPLSSPQAIRNAIDTRARLAQKAFDRYNQILTAKTPEEAVEIARRLVGEAYGGQMATSIYGSAPAKTETPRALPRATSGYAGGSRASADQGVKETLLQEWAKPQSSQADVDSLRAELKRAGVKILPPAPPVVSPSEAAAPAPAPAASGGWSIKRIN